MPIATEEGQEVTQQNCTVVYALEEPPEVIGKSIFLAGPTPRKSDVASWRPEALRILEETGYDGVVFVPEDRSGIWHGNYDHQVEWEERYLNMADVILFWVPRNMQDMPALTTNDEWGFWKDSGKVVLGSPKDAPSMRYQQHYARQLGVQVSHTLPDTVSNALALMAQLTRENCVFCQIIVQDKRNQVEWRGRDSVVITPLGPVVPGHRLVIPRVHVQDAFEHPGILGRTMRDASTYAGAKQLGDCNIITSVGTAATQTVFHLHVHLVPRVDADGLHLPWTGQKR